MPNAVLVDLLRVEVVADGRACAIQFCVSLIEPLPRMPSRRVQEADLRLRVVIAVQQRDRPAVEVRAGFDLEAPHFETALVEAEAGGERVDAVRLVGRRAT